MLSYKLLGSGGVMPLPNRYLTALYVQYKTTQVLIDCGENIQTAAKRFDCSLFAVDAIFLTHLHSDHTLGLPGLLTTLNNLGRTKPLIVYGPLGTTALVSKILNLIGKLSFFVYSVEIHQGDTIDFGGLTVEAFKLEHSVLCFGYSVEVVRAPSYNEDVVQKTGLTAAHVAAVQCGYILHYGNLVLSLNNVFGPDRDRKKIVYATDTGYCPALVKGCRDADVAIVEGSYGDASQIPKSMNENQIHMTFEQAATAAKEANVKSLILTHFSPTMPDPENYINNARSIFPNTMCAYDGLCNSEDYKQTDDLHAVTVNLKSLDNVMHTGRGFIMIEKCDNVDQRYLYIQDEFCQKVLQVKIQDACRVSGTSMQPVFNMSELVTAFDGLFLLYVELAKVVSSN